MGSEMCIRDSDSHWEKVDKLDWDYHIGVFKAKNTAEVEERIQVLFCAELSRWQWIPLNPSAAWRCRPWPTSGSPSTSPSGTLKSSRMPVATLARCSGNCALVALHFVLTLSRYV